MKIDKARLSNALDYEPETGVFRWKNPTSLKHKPGDIAGRLKSQKSGAVYREIRLNGKLYPAIRLAWTLMTGEYPDFPLSPENGDGADLRWVNIVRLPNPHRRAIRNRRRCKGCPGVIWNKRERKWEANIWGGGKFHVLIRCNDWFEAVCARKSAEFRFGYDKNHGRSVRKIESGRYK